MTTEEFRKETLNQNLKEIVNNLKKRYKPEKIILFGSLISGKITESSDIDLLIIKNTKKNPLLRKREARAAAHSKIAFDPLVLTPGEIKTRLKWQDFFIKDIINKGEILYANTK